MMVPRGAAMQRRAVAGRPGLPGPAATGRVTAGPAAAALAAAALVAGLSGCAASHPPAARRPAVSCGTTRTAAQVPIRVEIRSGQISCRTAMSVERAYAKAVEAGRAPGNGGGGPVRVHGWTCQGFSTPVVLRTGNASKCVQGSNLIVAILPVPA
jgi:hypothetical protein